ncbi:MAG: hypothetical protein P8P98_04350 [Emcibacteraceae bacterium]|nr:hypothetical protein [Emcibacteraceae bacterium]
MTNKFYWLSVVAAYITMGVVATGLVSVFGAQMQSMAAQGRPMDEMEAMMGWQLGGYFLITSVFVYIYSKGRESGGWLEGARFGFIFSLAMCGVSLWSYNVYPWEFQTLLADMFINVVNYSIGGAVVGLIYKPA